MAITHQTKWILICTIVQWGWKREWLMKVQVICGWCELKNLLINWEKYLINIAILWLYIKMNRCMYYFPDTGCCKNGFTHIHQNFSLWKLLFKKKTNIYFRISIRTLMTKIHAHIKHTIYTHSVCHDSFQLIFKFIFVLINLKVLSAWYH